MVKTHPAAVIARNPGRKGFYLVLAALLGWAGLFVRSAQKTAEINDDALVSALVTAEETYLALTPKMNALSKGLLDLRLPVAAAQSIFGPSVVLSDLGPIPAATVTNAPMIETRSWPVDATAKKVTQVDLWRPLLDAVSSFEHAKLFIAAGNHPKGDPLRYEANAGFEALAKMKTGEWRSLHARMTLIWERAKQASDNQRPEWQITYWKPEQLDGLASPKRLFVESLDTALRRPDDLEMARHSNHYQETVKYYRDGMKKPPHPYFAPISVNQKEGIAIADIDGDGF